MEIQGELMLLLVPMTFGIVAAAGATGRLPSGWKPLVSLAVGLCLGALFSLQTPLDGDALRSGVITGIVSALTASGLWSSADTLTSTKARRS